MAIEDYEKRKLDRLEKFERTVSGVLDTIDLAISWVWAILILALTAFLYFKPIEATPTLQAGFMLVTLLFLLIISVIWRAIGKSKGANNY